MAVEKRIELSPELGSVLAALKREELAKVLDVTAKLMAARTRNRAVAKPRG